MNVYEFKKGIRKLGQRSSVNVSYQTHGKGSHGRLYFGDRFTTLKDRKKEIGTGLLKAMCAQLGISATEL